MIKRIITCFDNKTEELTKEIDISTIPLQKLQEIFDVERKNPMYDCYQITIDKKDFFEMQLKESFDLINNSYYVEAYEI